MFRSLAGCVCVPSEIRFIGFKFATASRTLFSISGTSVKSTRLGRSATYCTFEVFVMKKILT